VSIRQSALATAAALVIVAVGWTVLQGRAERPKQSLPTPAAITRPAPLALPLTARDILNGGVLLDLKAAQRRRLRALDATWARESAAAQAALDAATADFSRFMDEARATGRTSLQEIQRRSAEISDLSATLRERRQRHIEAAAASLTDRQRTKLGEVTRAVAAGGQR
jgi:hypothetical protein